MLRFALMHHSSQYELVRSAPALRKLKIMLRSLAVPNSSSLDESPSNALSRLITAATYYEEKIASAQSRTASQALRVVARNIDRDGIYGLIHDSQLEDPP